MARRSLTKIGLLGHYLMWVSSAAAPSHVVHLPSLFLIASSISLGELLLYKRGVPNQGTGEAAKSSPFLWHHFLVWWPCQDCSLWEQRTQLRGQVKGLRGKGTISWGLLNSAWISFYPSGWGDKAPAFPSLYTLYPNDLPIKGKFLSLSTQHLPLPFLTSTHSWITTSSFLSALGSVTPVSVLR